MTNTLLAGVLTLVAFTQAQPPKDTHGIVRVDPGIAKTKPYDRLFLDVKPLDVVPVKPVTPRPVAALAAAPVVLMDQMVLERGGCNMPVIRANPEVDPKMIIPVQRERVQAKIRVIEPPVCWEK